jgi:hypothetical protein
MDSKHIEEFARILVQEVRDMAIRNCDSQLEPESQTLIAKRWRKAASVAKGQLPPREIVPDCVDSAVFYLLHAIDQGLLPLRFVSKSGEVVDLAEDGMGELAGEYMCSGGWREMSKERYVDDFGDPT